ncbi:MAG: FlgO family outer membrane protein [Pseudomonadota bacterium]
MMSEQNKPLLACGKMKRLPGACIFPAAFAMLAACLIMLLSGCFFSGKRGGTVSLASPDFFGFGDNLARQLVANRGPGATRGERLILTTFVSLDDLYETSGLGRALTEGLSTSLFKKGFRIAEIRKAQGLYVKDDSGEFMLTRDAALVAKDEEAQAIIVGTYSVTPRTVILNVKMVEADSAEVLSVAGLEIERSANVNFLLAANGGATVSGPMSAYER